jgi:hypothetical protein
MDKRVIHQWILHYYQGAGDNDDRYCLPGLFGRRYGDIGRRLERRRKGFELAYSGSKYRPVRFGVGGMLAVSAEYQKRPTEIADSQ